MAEPLLASVLLLTGAGIASALALTVAQRIYPRNDTKLVRLIERELPQTQCGQCGYPGCGPYAEAVAQGEAINRCPPGGDSAIAALAALLGREATPLDPECGEHQPRKLAKIREGECIGCALCIPACPVDAIVGAPRLMHVVLRDLCTGCDLCREPCPVDCIELVPHPEQDPQPRFPPLGVSGPCINCGLCERACPRELKPQLLFHHRRDNGELEQLHLDNCIECGMCDRQCPAGLPLTGTFRASKLAVANARRERQRADLAESLFLKRTGRVEGTRSNLRTRPGQDDKAMLLQAAREESGAESRP